MSDAEIKRKFEQELNRVKGAIVAASEHYNIWHIYKDDRPRYENVMHSYLGFFRASISAQFTAMLLTLSKVLDKNTKNNRISMYSLVDSAEKHNLIKPSKLQEIRIKLCGTAEKFKKLQILRNNVFAHLGNLDTEKAFKLAGISPNDLAELIDSSKSILRSIYYAYDRSGFAFDDHSEKDTYWLLNDLQKSKADC